MAMAEFLAAVMPSDRSLLIVEDDKCLLQRLARAMEGRGFAVSTAKSVAEGLDQLQSRSPAFAVVDMRLDDGNGLEVVSRLKQQRPDARAIILTGYGNIATAVNAVKLGAIDYLSKPVDADEVVAALLAVDGRKVSFDVTVKDELDTVGAGTHTRFVVDKAKTFERIKAKAARFAARAG